jgi:hypothetical protein
MRTDGEFKFWISHLDRKTHKMLTLRHAMALSMWEIQTCLNERASLCHVPITQPQAIADDLVTEATQQTPKGDVLR